MTFRSFAGREYRGVRVGGYRNLASRDPKTQWSFKALDGPDKGLKVAEGESAALTDCAPYVRRSTRERILAGSADQAKGQKGHREVHAWITGILAEDEPELAAPARVTYHPFERGDFFYPDTGETFTGAALVVFSHDGHCYTERAS